MRWRCRCWRARLWCRRFSVASPDLELPADRLLDDAEQIAGRVAHRIAAAPRRPLIEHRLPLGFLHLLQSDHRPGLLLVFQAQEALGQSQVLERLRAQYCTYFINTILTYCTVLLRIPKRAIRCGFRPHFGFRRRGICIPKQAFCAVFGIVADSLLWITWRRPAMPGHVLRQHLQARRQRAPAEQRVLSDLLQRVHADDLHRLGGMGEGLAHQAQVVGVELHRLEGRQRFVMQDI